MALVALLLSACGGGGGSSDSSTVLAVSPSITVQPSDQTVASGASAMFAVTAIGTTPAYQWQTSTDGTNWVNASGATSTTYSLSALTVASTGMHVRVMVSNTAGSVTSTAALLTVLAPPVSGVPTIASQPADASVSAPTSVSFVVSVTGTPAPTIQWQRSNDGGVTFTNIAGATAATYTIATTATSDNAAQFRAVVTNSAGSATSRAAVLNVTAAPVAPAIITQPTAAGVTAPASASFNVVATGSPTVTYQWQLSTDAGVTFNNISGATSASYNTPATTTANSGQQYRVSVSNGTTTLLSQAATLTVAAASVTPGSASACISTQSYAPGSTVNVVYESPSSIGTSLLTVDSVVNGTVAFHGQPATEVETTSTFTPPPNTTTSTTTDTKTYSTIDPSSLAITTYGQHAVTSIAVAGGTETIASDGVVSPASVDTRYQLNPGASTSIASTQTVSIATTLNGVTGATSVSTVDGSSVVMFVGVETLTVPAGTFQSCKFVQTSSNNVQTTSWTLYGNGTQLKSASGTAVQQARSILVNGSVPH